MLRRRARHAPTTTSAPGTSCSRGVHPDVVEIDPPATQIRIEDAQAIIDEVSRSPIEGERKVVVLFDAERLRLNEAAANKLLKTLEEPPPRAVIVLVTAGADQLLPTIRSRCQRVDFAFLGRRRGRRRARRRRHPRRARRAARAPRRRSPRPRACARRPSRPGARRVRRRGRRRSTAPAARSPSRPSCVQDGVQARALGLEAGAGRGGRAARRRARSRGLPRAHAARAAAAARGAAQARAPSRAHRRALEGITALETVYRDALAGRRDERAQPRPRRARDRAAGRGGRARRVPRRPPGDRRVQPERDPAARAPLPPPPAGRRRRRKCLRGR